MKLYHIRLIFHTKLQIWANQKHQGRSTNYVQTVTTKWVFFGRQAYPSYVLELSGTFVLLGSIGTNGKIREVFSFFVSFFPILSNPLFP